MKNRVIKLIYKIACIQILLCISMLSSCLFASMDLVYDLQTAKISGMGGSNVSNVTGAESIFYNWATPGSYLEWKLEQAAIVEDNYYIGSIQNPFNISKLRFGFLYQSIGDLAETSLNAFNQPVLTGSTFNHQMIALFSSFSSHIFNTNIGLRHTFFYESIKSDHSLSNQFDLALLKTFRIHKYPINYGLNIKNLFKSNIKWSTDTQDPSARLFTTGLSGTLFDERLIISTDRIFSFQKGYSQTSTGIEYYIIGNSSTKPYMILRGGLCKTKISVGTSINLDGWIFDYSYNYDTPFNNISSSETIEQHRFSIGKSLKPFSSIKSELEFNKSSLEKIKPYQLESFFQKPSPIKNQSPLVDMQIDVNFDTNSVQITPKKIDNSIVSRLNFNTLLKDETITESLPIKWIAYRKSEQTIFMVDIETTQSNKIHISGYIPNYLDVHLNGELINTINADNSFYKKITPSATTETLQFKLQPKI
jgi:hypothetical protein